MAYLCHRLLRRRGVEAGSSRRRGVQQPKVSADLKRVSHERNAKWDLSHLISSRRCGMRGPPRRTWPSTTQCQTTSSACGQQAPQRAPRPRDSVVSGTGVKASKCQPASRRPVGALRCQDVLGVTAPNTRRPVIVQAPRHICSRI